MTKEQQAYKDALPAIQAFTECKTIQVSDRKGIPNWTDFDGEFPDFGNVNWQWRVKPTPTLRPWKPEEVPVGASVRNKSTRSRYLITDWNCAAPFVIKVSGIDYTFKVMLDNYEHSLDHGKTWLPCGVVE